MSEMGPKFRVRLYRVEFLHSQGQFRRTKPVMRADAVARLVGIEGGVVSGVFNLESSGVRAVGLETTP